MSPEDGTIMIFQSSVTIYLPTRRHIQGIWIFVNTAVITSSLAFLRCIQALQTHRKIPTSPHTITLQHINRTCCRQDVYQHCYTPAHKVFRCCPYRTHRRRWIYNTVSRSTFNQQLKYTRNAKSFGTTTMCNLRCRMYSDRKDPHSSLLQMPSVWPVPIFHKNASVNSTNLNPFSITRHAQR
jgi:hypothetical protein